ncbi:MAG: TAXI family TRAP transporter solute-binding subunit [Vicinamibacterales bacterium]
MRTLQPTGMIALCCLAATVLTSACTRRAGDTAPPRRTFRMITGGPTTASFRLGQALAAALRSSGETFDLQLLPNSAGSVDIIRALKAGEAEFAFALATAAYETPEGGGATARDTNVRAIALVEPSVLHLVVPATSPVRALRDLRGLRVGVGRPGGASALAAQWVLLAAGVPPDFVSFDSTVSPDTPALLANNRIDAISIFVRAPYEGVAVAMKNGARLVPIGRPVIERLQHDYPFVYPTFIPPNTYAGQPEAIRTIGIDSLIVCRHDVDEDTVFTVARHLVESLPTFAARDTSRVNIPYADATPIPLHEGAARYYRARTLHK